MKVIIVGGVAGGASAAARLRRLDEQAEIIIYELTGYVSYANCGLPYYLGEIIENKSDLTLQTPESLFRRFNIDVKVHHEVLNVDAKAKTITVLDTVTGEKYQNSYDKLLLSPGAKAIRPDIPGADLENVFTLRTVEDAFQIYDHAKKANSKSTIIAGGGFIGLELAENLRHLGLDVTIVQSSAQTLSVLDPDMVPQVHEVLRKNGVKLVFKKKIMSIEKKDDAFVCSLSDGAKLTADLVVFAIGVVPDSSLAEKAGLTLGTKRSIVVNDYMQTSDPSIYAVGDAVEVKHFVTEDKTVIALAGPANKQGRIAANNIAGGDSRYKGTQGSLIIKLFDMTAAATGINEKQARRAHIDYEKAILFPSSHASYYPDATLMMIKVLFEKHTAQLLGAQIVGFDGVDKRIDVISTALRAGMKASELAELELAYAPPYGSAKDAVNMAGFIIENLVTGKLKQFYYEDIENLQRNDKAMLLDVRTPYEYAQSHVEGFINIPVDELRNRFSEIPKNKHVYVMCQSGARSYIACCILSAHGYECYNFAGGYRFYSMQEQ